MNNFLNLVSQLHLLSEIYDQHDFYQLSKQINFDHILFYELKFKKKYIKVDKFISKYLNYRHFSII